MSMAPYTGMYAVPGMGAQVETTEHDNSDIFFGPLWTNFYLNFARVDGASRDAGNTGFTTVLRPGLVMGIITASGKWAPFTSGASDGTEVARGILLTLGLNMQEAGADADRWVASILIKGMCYPEAVCIASTAGYGLARTSVGLTVRKHLMYSITFCDDVINELTDPIATRPYG